MNPLQITRIVVFKSLALVTLCLIASVFLLRIISASSTAQSQAQERKKINGKVVADKESPAQRLAFAENGPLGRWSGSIIPDLSRNSSNSPVVVIGTGALMGNKELRNLQLTHVTLKNHSAKTVLGVQLKWFVTTKKDRAKILPPPGYTGLFETYLKPGDIGRFESPLVMFSQAVKYLISNGRLEGDFVVQVKVFQVEFEGGSTWNEVIGVSTCAAATTPSDLVGHLLRHPRPHQIRTAPRLDGMATAHREPSRTDLAAKMRVETGFAIEQG